MVNGTPDTAYYMPIQTDVLYNKKTGIPLGFSYDGVVNAFRVVYIPTGDPMFSYIYDDALDAVKGRAVHMKMLNWALEPQDIAMMYRQWYGGPERYDAIFKLLHQEMFGELPPFYLKVEGIFDAEKYYPNWRDQRAQRNTLLSGVGGMGGIQNNSEWSQDSYEKRLEGQLTQEEIEATDKYIAKLVEQNEHLEEEIEQRKEAALAAADFAGERDAAPTPCRAALKASLGEQAECAENGQRR